MRDYEELVDRLRSVKDTWQSEEEQWMLDAADAIEELQKALDAVNDAHNEGYDVGYWAGRRDYEPKWISVEEPPNNDRNIFICHGSVDFKAPCIGHYDLGMKMFYEDKNWFASPIYDAMFWCEMPKLPLLEPPKEEK